MHLNFEINGLLHKYEGIILSSVTFQWQRGLWGEEIWADVLVFCGFCNKLPQTFWPKTEKYFSVLPKNEISATESKSVFIVSTKPLGENRSLPLPVSSSYRIAWFVDVSVQYLSPS
jgi:hypothetical protein